MTSGIVTTEIGNSAHAKKIILHGNKIALIGYSYSSSIDHFTIARYTYDGALDTTFNTTGAIELEASDPEGGRAHSAVLDYAGRYILGGFAGDQSPGDALKWEMMSVWN